jgi:hypothetical protein
MINRRAPYETAPLDELLALLLRQLRRPLLSQGVTLTDAECAALARDILSGQPADHAEVIRRALLELTRESEAVLARWNLTYGQSLDTPMERIPGWETTAEFLDIANEKSNAELRIAACAALLVALGDPTYAETLRLLAERAPDLETVIARRVLDFTGA